MTERFALQIVPHTDIATGEHLLRFHLFDSEGTEYASETIPSLPAFAKLGNGEEIDVLIVGD